MSKAKAGATAIPVEEQVDDSDFTMPLSKPIAAYGEQITELKFTAPTGGDLLMIGNPVIFDMSVDPPTLRHDFQIVPKMISRLAKIPPSSVAAMQPQDIIAAAWLITSFFVPAGVEG